MSLLSVDPLFVWSANVEGLAIRFYNPKRQAKAREGRGDEAAQLGLVRMQMLAESGQAEIREIEAGIFIAAADAVRIDLETREGFLLPPAWPGGLRLRTDSVPQSPRFTAALGLVDGTANIRWDWKLRGPILENRWRGLPANSRAIRRDARPPELAGVRRARRTGQPHAARYLARGARSRLPD